ncbi:hypothetical protein HYC85_003852 [Camellia sinensis]|uniref:Uncharacterized protein n=1 Tax=Camellia sinensis TaxID=4442 RepID=A0A7J7HW31_CAMSI|nr:hypothetical protein HYC85_003852 [Camellia sinensis]
MKKRDKIGVLTLPLIPQSWTVEWLVIEQYEGIFNLARTSGCKGSNTTCGLDSSLRDNSHHSSHGITTIISSP